MFKPSWLTRFALVKAKGFWKRTSHNADQVTMSDLAAARHRAKDLQSILADVIFKADYRLARPQYDNEVFYKPPDADWSWRPELWSGQLRQKGLVGVGSSSKLGNEVSMFHDCEANEMTLRQIRNYREKDLAPFGMQLEVYEFSGSFLSVALDFPPKAIAGLNSRHIVHMETVIECEKPLEIFGRLNIRHGPNVEQIVRALPTDGKSQIIEFDLGYVNLIEKRVEHIWLDLIFEEPSMNDVILRDVTFHRRPRAEF